MARRIGAIVLRIKVKDILKLQPSQESVAEILNFIEHKTLTVLEHQTVFIHLMKTYYALKAYPIVLNEGMAYHEKIDPTKSKY